MLGNGKIVEYESDGYTNCNWCFWYSHQRIGTRTGGLENKRTNGDHPNNSIIEFGHNTEKSPGNLRRLAVTQTPVRYCWLALEWKTQQGVTMICNDNIMIILNNNDM